MSDGSGVKVEVSNPDPPPGVPVDRRAAPQVQVSLPNGGPSWLANFSPMMKFFIQFGFAGLMAAAFSMIFLVGLFLFKQTFEAQIKREDEAAAVARESLKEMKDQNHRLEVKLEAARVESAALAVAYAAEAKASRERLDAKLEGVSSEMRSLTNTLTSLASEVRAGRQKAEAEGLVPRPKINRAGPDENDTGEPSALKTVYREPLPMPRPAPGG